MLSAQVTQIIDQDIAILNQQDGIQGKIGKILGYGTYGFVCEWNDRSGIPKVVKVRDPEYIQKKNGLSHSQTDTLLMTSVMPVLMEKLVANEQIATEKIAHTKHQNLMTILSGTQYAQLDDRDVLLMVMPRMQTIQDLPISEKREQQIAAILCDCCDGLHVLHREPQEIAGQKIGLDSMIHGDLKPDNIFVHEQQSGGSVTTWYVVGDYSSCMWLGQLQKYPQLAYPNEQGLNPYCAPGTIGVTSDIWSLGWILWYWMNGKVHPTQEDVQTRRKPDNWGDNPELWEVFLKMTDPLPSKRYQNVDVVRSELMRAMEKRQARLAQEASDSDKLEGALLTFVVGTVAYGIVKGICSFFRSRTDGNGEYHGKIRKDIDFMGGTFRGEWSHGMPVQGTFTCDGVKKTGRWAVKKDYQIRYSDFCTMTFSGLICVDNEESPYQGKARFEWKYGTELECLIIAGKLGQGIMIFPGFMCIDNEESPYYGNTYAKWQDGPDLLCDSITGILDLGILADAGEQKQKTGLWKYVNDSHFCGIACEDDSGFYGCGIRRFAEDTFYEGALWQGMPEGGDLVLPNRRIPARELETYSFVWRLLKRMEDYDCSFYGNWNANGHPTKGIFTFASGEKLQGPFDYTSDAYYSGITLYGKPCGIGKLILNDHMVVTGEFQNGACHGFAVVDHQCGAKVSGIWEKNCIKEAVLELSDGRTLFSKNWTCGTVRLPSGNILSGFFCDTPKKSSGIGTMTWMPQGVQCEGELFNTIIGSGHYLDPHGNPISKEQAEELLRKRR